MFYALLPLKSEKGRLRCFYCLLTIYLRASDFDSLCSLNVKNEKAVINVTLARTVAEVPLGS